MQTDLSDGVAELARQGVVDAKRVAIAGASYGGYAALAGVAFQKDVYRCAVSVAGPADMYRQLDYLKEKNNWDGRNPASRYWRNYLQVKSDNDKHLGEISPALHAEGITVPVMLIHGKDDTVVPFDQSQKMERALKALNRPVELVTLKGEDHNLSKSETRLEMLTRSVTFLETCNPVG
jgi:dipeptidyl aminopeptidase/acylaminoacyl peptidase